MRTKDISVQACFHSVLTQLLFDIDQMYRDQWGEELILTSGSEHTARHSRTSLHYATPGQAADTRIWQTGNIPAPDAQLLAIKEVVSLFCSSLNIPEDWIEVILESDHIHIEYQPKRPKELN